MVDEKITLRIFEHYFGAAHIIKGGRYAFSDDGSELHVYGPLFSKIGLTMPDGMWPLQFGVIQGDVDISNSGLRSLEGSPREVYGNMNIANNPLTSLAGCTKKITGVLNITGIEFQSLEGLPPDLLVRVTWYRQMPMMRLLTCKRILLSQQQMQENSDSPAQKVLAILRKHQVNGKRAMFDCQKELEDKGFEENAKW